MKSLKKRLTEQQEFEIMKLVLDKLLWLGFIIMGFGLYQMYYSGIASGLVWMVSGAILLILFMIIIVKEYEVVR